MPITTRRARAARALAGGLVVAAAFAFTVPAAASAAPASSVSAVTPMPSAINVAAAPAAGTPMWTVAHKLGLRGGPSNDHKVTIIAYKDSRVKYTGKSRNGWLQVKLARFTAWTPAKFLTTTKPAWDPIRVGTTAPNLGLRAGPSNDYKVRVWAERDTGARFTGLQKNGWWQVKINGTWAWTPQKFLHVGGYYDRGRTLRVGHSQVGYREPSWRTNKYNSWINGDNAWCAVFVAWVFDKSDYKAGVPKRKHFDDYVADLRRAGVLDTTPTASELKKGHVVLIDWYPRNGPTHTGIVDHVSGNTVWLVEGNTTDGSGSSTRGVFYRQRMIADVHAVYDPVAYAKATMTW